MTWQIYHNPRCSKSRETLALLEENGIKPQVVLYLEEPPSEAELTSLIKKLKIKPAELVRKKEKEFAALKLKMDDDKAVIKALAKHPVLIERPIVVKGAAAVLGRPPENVLKLLK